MLFYFWKNLHFPKAIVEAGMIYIFQILLNVWIEDKQSLISAFVVILCYLLYTKAM